MKWTDNMVKLLILAVYYIGDEVGSEGNNDSVTKKKAGALLQKKGKWKSVSRAMMEKGFYVSPQQCEDKFNDLNKRYKRVNDILGKGTACRVVENQSLLDSMDLSPKMKEEVRKLLNSKHLFFREMCAYHNSCGHNSTGAAPGTNQAPEGAVETSHTQHQQIQQQQQQQQHCLHSTTDNARIMANSLRAGTEVSRMGKRVMGEEGEGEEVEEEDESDEDEDDESDDDEEETEEGNARAQHGHGQEEEDEHDVGRPLKRPRREGTSASIQQLNDEVTSVMQDAGKTPWEKSQWLKLRLLHLEEQQVNHQFQAFEIEKQRLKWLKFSSKKEREMNRAKLKNEQRQLENERMMLLVREKAIELPEIRHHHPQQHSPNKKSEPSSVTG